MRSLIPGEENSHLKSSNFEVEFSNFVGEGYLKKRKQITQTKSESQIVPLCSGVTCWQAFLIVLQYFSTSLSKKQAK